MNLLQTNGFLQVNLIDHLESEITPESRVKNSWHNLKEDEYILQKPKYRYRRYSCFKLNLTTLNLEFESSNYFQKAEYNSLFGGVNRIFAPVELDSTFYGFIKPLTLYDYHLFNNNGLIPNGLLVGIHQIRTVAKATSIGQVTPEGLHKDGHEVFAIHLINRNNVSGGSTKLYSNDLELQTTITLEKYLDSLFVQDSKIYHEVTPISVVNENEDGYRDVLIIEFY